MDLPALAADDRRVFVAFRSHGVLLGRSWGWRWGGGVVTGTTAVVVRFRSTDATRAVVWAPIDVRLLDAQGHVLARTNIPGADPALVHVPSIAPGETGFYVNDQLTPDDPAKVASARVVLGGDPVTLTAPLRNLDVLRPRIVDDPDYGWSFTATVANGTGIPQHRVIVQGIVRRKGQIVAEYEVKPEHWYFACHFKGDPVMPGCLGLDALWQLTGFFLGWLGASGRGRALGVGEVKFTGIVLPSVKKLEYVVEIKRVILRRLKLAIADGLLKADGVVIYTAKDLRVGLFEAGMDPSAQSA